MFWMRLKVRGGEDSSKPNCRSIEPAVDPDIILQYIDYPNRR